jgi:hypothetical protein
MKWFKKKHEGDKPISLDAALELWLTCPKWLGEILLRLDTRVKEVDETLENARG